MSKNEKPRIIQNATVVVGIKNHVVIQHPGTGTFILILTCVDNFQLEYVYPKDDLQHWIVVEDMCIMDQDVKSIILKY